MDGVGLGGDDEAVALHHAVEVDRHASLDHRRARRAQRGHHVVARRQRGVVDGRAETAPAAARRCDARADRRRSGARSNGGACSVAGSSRVGPGHGRGEEPDVLGGVRERADRVQRGGERHRSVQADQAVGRLEARQTACGGGNAHRAAGVGADRGRGEARGNGDGRAAARAAGDAMHGRVPGVPRRAHRRVAAPASEGELDHVRLAERDHPGGDQALRPPSPCHSERRPIQLFEPAVVCRPSISSRSLSAIGRPCSGPRDVPVPARDRPHRRAPAPPPRRRRRRRAGARPARRCAQGTPKRCRARSWRPSSKAATARTGSEREGRAS